MKVSFVATSGTKFIITGQPTDADSRVMTEYVPSTRDLEEYVDWVREDREMLGQGPTVVTGYSTLLLNGGFLKITQDVTMEYGAIHFLNEMGRRMVLREGRAEREGPALLGASGGADAAGDAVASSQVLPHLGTGAQQDDSSS